MAWLDRQPELAELRVMSASGLAWTPAGGNSWGDEASTLLGQARRHHVVSKFYLRYFANDNERITTVMLPGERTFPQSIGDASVQTGYYTVIDQEGQQSDAAEQALSLVEAHAAAAWREVAAGVWPLPDEHRESMAAWVALQLLRGTSVVTR